MIENKIPDITIGVAVYNASSSLLKCLKSISSQNFMNFEVILVDDGCTDDSGQILDDYAIRDKRFRVIHQKNAGVGATRNRVIHEAKGDYLCFIDPDDWVEETYLAELWEALYKDGELNGVVIEGFKKYKEDGTFITETDSINELVLKNNFDELFDRLKLTERGHACSKLYSMNAIRRGGVLFHEDLAYFEDLIFILELMDYLDYIKIVPVRNYHYIFYSNSLSNRIHTFEKEYNVFCQTEKIIMSKVNLYQLNLLDCPQTHHILFVPFLRTLKSDFHHWKEVSYVRAYRDIQTLCKKRTNFIINYFIPEYKIEKLSKLLLSKRFYLIYLIMMRIAFVFHLQQMYYPSRKQR